MCKIHNKSSNYTPNTNLPATAQAIEKLVQGFKEGNQFETLLGVTGSGKTFTMANVIARLNKPTLHSGTQQNPCGAALRRIQRIFPGECGGILCVLL